MLWLPESSMNNYINKLSCWYIHVEQRNNLSDYQLVLLGFRYIIFPKAYRVDPGPELGLLCLQKRQK